MKDCNFKKTLLDYSPATSLARETNCIMIVGQDFGTVEYIKNQKFIDIGEEDNPTMRNF